MTYAIPQKDVRPLARKLLDSFGNLESVLSAPEEALCQIDGIKSNAAALLKLVHVMNATAPAAATQPKPTISPPQAQPELFEEPAAKPEILSAPEAPASSVETAAVKVMRAPARVTEAPMPENNRETGPNPVTNELADGERALLVDVMQYPLSGVVDRYRRLGVSRRKGTRWKEGCIQRDLLSPVDIPTRSGRITLLQIAEAGRRVLRELGHEVPDRSRWGSLEHEYWKQKAAERLQDAGYVVRVEEPVNGFTDIVAEKGPIRIAAEIETGRSNWAKNLVKNVKKGFTRILIITTNESAHREIAAEMEQEAETKTAEVIQAQEFVESRDLGVYGL